MSMGHWHMWQWYTVWGAAAGACFGNVGRSGGSGSASVLLCDVAQSIRFTLEGCVAIEWEVVELINDQLVEPSGGNLDTLARAREQHMG